jgi:hypothetical protein
MGWQGYSNLTPEQKAQRQYMMERRMEMHQMLMDQMMMHQQQQGAMQPGQPGRPAQ